MNSISSLKRISRKKNKDTSLYWSDRLTKDLPSKNKYYGFGGFKYRKFNTISFYILNFIHLFFQIFTFKFNFFKIFNSKIYKITKKFSYNTGTPLDWRKLRHCFAFKKLDKYLKNVENLCIIGDGFATATYLALENYPNIKKIISVNLNQILFDDYLVLKKNKIKDNEICHCQSETQFKNFLNSNKKVCFISSDNKNILKGKKIDFFFNMFSFNEMTKKTIRDYIRIIKSCKSYIYSCNPRKEWTIVSDNLIVDEIKDLGEINFLNSKKIFKEKPFWLNKIYYIKTLNIFGERYSKSKEISHSLRKFK